MDIFNALAEPTRRNIIEVLAEEGELQASDIYKHFDVSQSAISQHLKVLKQVKLVRMEKRAQKRMYQLNLEKLTEMSKWIEKLEAFLEERFEIMDKLIKKEKSKK